MDSILKTALIVLAAAIILPLGIPLLVVLGVMTVRFAFGVVPWIVLGIVLYLVYKGYCKAKGTRGCSRRRESPDDFAEESEFRRRIRRFERRLESVDRAMG